MSRNFISGIFIAPLILFLLTGCSKNPVASDASIPFNLTTGSTGFNPVSHQCAGFYVISIDTETGEIDVYRSHTGQIHLNMVSVLNNTMGVTAVGVPSEHDPVNGIFVFDITLTHPFAVKPQLSGFDVKGILITPGTQNTGPVVFAGNNETRLLNADGYTRWWNPTEFTQPGLFGYTQGILASAASSLLTATCNPYKYFADCLGPLDTMLPVYSTALDSDDGRGVFRAGNSNTRRYRIRFPLDPGPQVVFGYAVDASWVSPVPNPPSEIPDDFPIEANQPEAYYVCMTPAVNTLYYDGETGNGGGVLRLQVDVYDWQGQDAGDVEADIGDVAVFGNDLFAGSYTAVFLDQTEITARYTWDLMGIAVPKYSGETSLAVGVLPSDDFTYDQGTGPAPSGKVLAWNMLTLDVPDPECSADDNNNFSGAEPLDFGEYVSAQLCTPIDQQDFYSFSIPSGSKAAGRILLFSDAAATGLTLYDLDENTILELGTVDDIAIIDFSEHVILPGTYYLGVGVGSGEWVKPYFLEMDAELFDVTPNDIVEVTPPEIFAEPVNVWIHDNYAYMAGYYGVWVYDLTDPSNPLHISTRDYSVSYSSCFYYPYCYTARYAGDGVSFLDLIDFSDPENPVLYDEVIQYDDSAGPMVMNSTDLYMRAGTSGAWEIEIYDYCIFPTTPILQATINTSYKPEAMALRDPEGPDTYLVVSESLKLHAYSVEDPYSIDEVVPYLFSSGGINDIEMVGDLVFLAYSTSGGGELRILDLVTDMPGFVAGGTVDVPGNAYYILCNLPWVYLGDGDAGLSICNADDILNPSWIGSWDLISRGFDLAADDDTLCIIANEAGMHLFDITNAPILTPLGHLPVVNGPIDAAVSGNYMYVPDFSNERRALVTFDISDPANASVVAEMELVQDPGRVSLSGNRMVMAAYESTYQLLVFDTTIPADPVILDTVSGLSYINDVELHGDYAYVSESPSNVQVFDISTIPATPGGGFLVSAAVRDFSFYKNYMYLTTSGTVEIFLIDNPMIPVHSGNYSIVSMGMETQVQGDYLYIVTEDRLEITRLTNPVSPSFVGSTSLGFTDPVVNMVVDGEYTYVVGTATAPFVFDTWPANAPSILGPFHTHETYIGFELLAHDGYVYELSDDYGIRIYEVY